MRNFGMPHPEGYRKALRLMRYAARFGMPIVTLVDTPGAYPGVGAEERGQSVAIAEGPRGGAVRPDRHGRHRRGRERWGTRAVGDRVLAMENAYYSVISPEGCLTILFKTPPWHRGRRRCCG